MDLERAKIKQIQGRRIIGSHNSTRKRNRCMRYDLRGSKVLMPVVRYK
jgi:hypothetical protein